MFRSTPKDDHKCCAACYKWHYDWIRSQNADAGARGGTAVAANPTDTVRILSSNPKTAQTTNELNRLETGSTSSVSSRNCAAVTPATAATTPASAKRARVVCRQGPDSTPTVASSCLPPVAVSGTPASRPTASVPTGHSVAQSSILAQATPTSLPPDGATMRASRSKISQMPIEVHL